MTSAGGAPRSFARAAGLSAYAAVKFLTRSFEARTLTPFPSYCLVAGFVSLFWLA